MKLLDVEFFVNEEKEINENVADILTTILALKKIGSQGKKLAKLHQEKAKEQIVKDSEKDLKKKDRSGKRIETLKSKIDVVRTTIEDIESNVEFMKVFVKKKVSAIKAEARLMGLEILDKFYKTDDLDAKIKTLKDQVAKLNKEADEEKGKLSDTQKEEIEKAKQSKGKAPVEKETKSSAKDKPKPKTKAQVEKAKQEQEVTSIKKEVELAKKTFNRLKFDRVEKVDRRTEIESKVKSDPEIQKEYTRLASEIQSIDSQISGTKKFITDKSHELKNITAKIKKASK